MFLTHTFLCFHAGVRGEELTALKTELWTEQGSEVSLGCSYYEDPTHSDYFYWYRQYPGKSPEFLLSYSGKGTSLNNELGLKFAVKDRDVHVSLSPVSVADSAVYHCAVRPTVTAKPQSLNKKLTAPHIH